MDPVSSRSSRPLSTGGDSPEVSSSPANVPHLWRKKLGVWLSVLLLVLGLFWAWWWMGMATLYVPICPTFSLDAPQPVCRHPIQGLMSGGAVAAVGLLGCIWAAYQRWRRAPASVAPRS
jgi:hypothetical protein